MVTKSQETDTGRSERALFDAGCIDIRRSLWARGVTPSGFPRLEGEELVDVAVVGAGLAGSSVALYLAERGVRVALVEAHEPGWGASGRNAGQAVPYRELDEALGKLPDRGEAFLDLLRSSGGIVYELASKHGIACDAVQGGYLQVAPHEKMLKETEKKAQKWERRGFPVRFVDRGEVETLTGTAAFRGGVLAEQGVRVNPFLFTRGLVDAARRAGAVVFSRSPVRSVNRDGSRWRLSTELGSVRADRVVACMNGYTDDAIPGLARAWCPLVAFAMATTPLPGSIRSSVLPGGTAMSLLPAGNHPLVVDADGRVISSLLARNLRPEKPPFRWLERWLHRTFPQTRGAGLGVDAYWTGSMAWSEDRLPRIFEVAPGLLALTCFSGEGNVPAPMLGRHLAEAIFEDDFSGLVLPVQEPRVPRWRSRYDIGLRKVGVPALLFAERLGLC
jgi:glycine/D-amino acid oxidase-like deaminating enzyme